MPSLHLLIELPRRHSGEESKIILASTNPEDVRNKGKKANYMQPDYEVQEVELDGVPDTDQGHAFVVRKGDKCVRAFCHMPDAAKLAYGVSPSGDPLKPLKLQQVFAPGLFLQFKAMALEGREQDLGIEV